MANENQLRAELAQAEKAAKEAHDLFMAERAESGDKRRRYLRNCRDAAKNEVVRISLALKAIAN